MEDVDGGDDTFSPHLPAKSLLIWEELPPVLPVLPVRCWKRTSTALSLSPLLHQRSSQSDWQAPNNHWTTPSMCWGCNVQDPASVRVASGPLTHLHLLLQGTLLVPAFPSMDGKIRPNAPRAQGATVLSG